MSGGSTSVPIRHLAKNRRRFLHAKSTVLHTPKEKTGAFENGSIAET